MLLVLIYAVATLFAPKGGFGKAVLLLNALIILLCFKVAAKWSAMPPEYNEWGMRQQSPDAMRFVGFALLASSLVLACRCFLGRPRKSTQSGPKS